jgi:hypothetical protein
MPKVRNWEHAVIERLHREREIEQAGLLAKWLNSGPDAPAGKWFKRFPKMIACGEGETIKSILRFGQAPDGAELK